MSDCLECADTTRKYGAPDRSCDTHWREDHPGGISIHFDAVATDPELIRLLFGESAA